MRRLPQAYRSLLQAVAALLMVLAGPAAATQDAWPALFDVTGVAADDVLNVRAEPSAASAIVGTIAQDARDVEVIAPNARQTWGQVNAGEAPGWVSLRFLRRQPGQWLGAIPEVRHCVGTEPFWSLSLDRDGAVTFATPDRDPVGGTILERVAAEGRRDRYAVTGVLDGPTGDEHLALRLALASCGDGMSDRSYGIEADLILDGADGARLLSGCCTLAGR